MAKSSEPDRAFDPRDLDKSTIALPLLAMIRDIEKHPARDKPIAVIIDVNLDYDGGRNTAKEDAILLIDELGAPDDERVQTEKTRLTPQYVVASLRGRNILKLVQKDKQRARAGSREGKEDPRRRAIYRVWPDFKVKAHTIKSIPTIKGDAALRAFEASGADIVWAVVDSGVSGHAHFEEYKNLELPASLKHLDFTAATGGGDALNDDFGHGTHVAGIIAGHLKRGPDNKITAATFRRDDDTDPRAVVCEKQEFEQISGVAPRCKILSMKVLDAEGSGEISSILAALAQIQEYNSHGRKMNVHGVNLSVGYEFDAEWFACGQSPVCVEVDRLVKSGVVVVCAAGNTGYGQVKTQSLGSVKSPLALSINDPGNAELAITVGSTHRDMPHVYGVSYFSSKGPTGDGRLKPDLLAPGEKIISCAAGSKRKGAEERAGGAIEYVEDSGTSMAAPHVSGAAAAFLSIRREFIGRPEAVKRIFLESATDLHRERHFQGHGLVDLMRAIQSV